jgi:hypothetical protein
MTTESYRFAVEAGDDRAAGEAAQHLSNDMREVQGVIEAERGKADHSAMDLGAIVTVVASSGATLALARGVAEWIRRTRGVSLKIERHAKSGSLKMAV